MLVDLENIKTESRNEKTKNIDLLSEEEILRIINDEDKKVAFAVEKAIPEITKLVKVVEKAIDNGGRLIYMGAGTSGRVGVIDAVECYPTFGVSNDEVMCLMAGGEKAFVKAQEGVEDDEKLAIDDLNKINITVMEVSTCYKIQLRELQPQWVKVPFQLFVLVEMTLYQLPINYSVVKI